MKKNFNRFEKLFINICAQKINQIFNFLKDKSTKQTESFINE